MKQTIRIQTFETNSSSYHTLSIYNSKEKPKQKEIVKGQDLVINTKINYKTIGYTESYNYVAYNSYTKAQLVLRFISSVIEEQLRDIVDCREYSDERGSWVWDKKNELEKSVFYRVPVVEAFVKAIKRYIGEDRYVTIEFTNRNAPFIDYVFDECKSISEIFGVEEKDLSDVNIMTEVFYNVIFNDEIEMCEECESNE